MALGEKRNINQISQVSWTDWTAQDVYYWLDHSFQYSANINTDDEMHWIKLSTRAVHTNSYAKCQLVSLGRHGVMAIPVDLWDEDDRAFKRFQYNGYYEQSQWTEFNDEAWTLLSSKYKAVPWVVFQDRLWFGANIVINSWQTLNKGYIHSVPLNVAQWTPVEDFQDTYLPYDHDDYTNESIETPTDQTAYMQWNITAILNYNNSRLVVAAGQDVWVYYPELDDWEKHWTSYYWQTWRKKVFTYEAW
jgi:hypothetical protein